MNNNQKKIIAISSSPSKGRNSDTMLDNFISGVKEENSDIEIEKVYLKDIPFAYYDHGNKSGPQEDEKEFADLAKKLETYRGIVIATPTYNFSVPAKLKNLIDRIGFIVLDPEKKNIAGQPKGRFKGKKMCFLVSGGTPEFVHFFLFFLFPGFWLKTIFAYFGAYNTKSFYSGDVETFKNKKRLKKCFKLGRKFAKGLL